MNENLNLYELLKDCPINTEFYCSEIDENVKFKGILYAVFEGITFMPNEAYSMVNADSVRYHICVNRYGSIFSKGKTPIIFPSKDQRDWSKWECPKQKKHKFDPKNLQPFDKVLVRDYSSCYWNCDFFSRIDDSTSNHKYITVSSAYIFCIPYNEETKHLVGTSEEAPEFYRYWED